MAASDKPGWQAMLEKHDPKLFLMSKTVQDTAISEGALSMKTKTLMMMLCDSLLAHPDGAAGLARRARALGATEQEIAETLEVAFLMGGLPALVTGSNAFRE
jgi:alkylhydroperoxidase/carboxymuconolactone decarboxylase family protein YurZ